MLKTFFLPQVVFVSVEGFVVLRIGLEVSVVLSDLVYSPALLYLDLKSNEVMPLALFGLVAEFGEATLL